MTQSPFTGPGLDVSVSQLVPELERDSVLLVDVREPHEWEAGRIAGAVHIPLAELGGQIAELDPSRTIVFQCLVGGRSSYAAEALRDAGFDAWSLAGGILEWVAEGQPLIPEDGQVVGH